MLFFWGGDSIFYYSASVICIDISYTQISVHLDITIEIILTSLARTKCNVSYEAMKMFRNNFPLTTLTYIRYYMFSYIIDLNSAFFKSIRRFCLDNQYLHKLGSMSPSAMKECHPSLLVCLTLGSLFLSSETFESLHLQWLLRFCCLEIPLFCLFVKYTFMVFRSLC